MLQQWNDPTFAHMHAPSGFPFTPNPVHLNQQYNVLPSHTNIHQNPSLRYEQHPLSSHSSGSPHPYHHRLSSEPFPLYNSTDPNSVTTAAATATSHHSLNPPDVHSLTSQFSSMTTSPKASKHTWSDTILDTHLMLLITLSSHLINNLFLIIILDKSILPIVSLSLMLTTH